MPLTTLVVDLGAQATGAALVTESQVTPMPDPVRGTACWPSQLALEAGIWHVGGAAERIRWANPGAAVDGLESVLESEAPVWLGARDLPAVTVLAAFLGALRTAAGRLLDRRAPGATDVDRLTLVTPSGYPVADRRRDLLIAAGEAAGFPEVELVDSATAVLLSARPANSAPVGQLANAAGVGQAGNAPLFGQVAYPDAARPIDGDESEFPDGSLVLVCDLGQTWSAGLLRVYRHDAVPLGHEGAPCGRDLDQRLLEDLHVQTGNWLDQQFGLPGEDGLRARQAATDFLRQIKHALCRSETDVEISGRLAPDAPTYTLRREWLDRLAEPGLRWVAASCRSLVARLAAGAGNRGSLAPPAPVPGLTLSDIRAVVLAGGHAHLPAAERILREELGRPVIRLDEPELAATRGAVRFVAAAASRRIPADHPRWRVEPFAWDIPTGRARVERWMVSVGEPYRRGAVLAQVRAADELLYDLTAADDGVLLSRRSGVGEIVGPILEAASKRPTSLLAGDPPGKRHELSGSGEWLFTPDQRVLVEYAPTADVVRLWSFPEGVLVREFRPPFVAGPPRRGRVFVNPAGRLALVAWDQAGSFSVWDVHTGERTITFRDPSQPTKVLVNEREWRLSTEGEDSGSAGRYRRAIATVWDLATGARLEKLTDDWHRRLAGYANRSQSDCFGDAAFSPDGRLRAVPVVSTAGPTGVSLQVAVSEQEVFRCEHPPSRRVRVAFTADGQFLLANRESPRDSHVDVWEL